MITWMQKHKKYLIITIWISTIAFVGAGFVGWGQYNYNNKAGSVAQVGEIELTRGELQKSYSRLYAQYNEMFQGNFDEEKAKAFGLQRQALKQLTDQALLLNLVKSYDMSVNNVEILERLTKQEYFFEDGVFNKEIYKQVLSRNNLTMAEYEADLKKQLLITKILELMPVEVTKNEINILETVMKISDKINYKVLTDKEITVDSSDTAIKSFWETKKQDYMTDVVYQIQYIEQEDINLTYTDAKISSYYKDNKTHFKTLDGKILPLEKARERVIEELNEKATKDMALRNYISYKKNRLDANITLNSADISTTNNIFNSEILEKISKISVTTPYMKPVTMDKKYYTIKLVKTVPSKVKDFKDAKDEVFPLYLAEMKKEKLLALANSSYKTFKGVDSDFITVTDSDKLDKLNSEDSREFLEKLFTTQKKESFIVLNSGKVVLYKIVEQKLLSTVEKMDNSSIENLKTNIFNDALIKNLDSKYNTEILVEGL
ncbi:MAG: peptidylprolyl isomerase [Campylobacterota bacterium]|nr:peptidylprolyl isomerase [Campylobacterota bacterium]